MIGACGGKKLSSPESCANFLLAGFDQAGAERISDIRTFAGETLYEYIDGGAEIYHTYGFIEVATADYKIGDVEMTADIYRFSNADSAYGLYASQRPDNPQVADCGAEGFATSTSVDFVKNIYVVHVIAFERSDMAAQAVSALAKAIDTELPGDDYPPQTFALFPIENTIPGTDMFYAESFLGRSFLADVYSRRFLVDSDTLTFFLTADPGGEKFARWFELGAVDGSVQMGPEDLPYDYSRVLVADNSYYGKIIAGEKGENLVGIIGYDDNKRGLLTSWLDSMQ